MGGAAREAVEEVVVGEGEGVDGVAAAVAADEVEEAVDVAELLLRCGGPVVGLPLVEAGEGGGVVAAAAAQAWAAASARRSTAWGSTRSSGMPRSWATPSAISWLRSARERLAPASASRLATTGPRPPPAPAMAMTLPSRSGLMTGTLSGCA